MIIIDINQETGAWPPNTENIINSAVEAASQHLHVKNNSEVSILLCDDAMIQDLNKTYRNQDKPTNVLSFPQDEGHLLGDIVLALETIQREAQDQDKPFENHLKHMIIHGFLHLNGFDHLHDKEAEDMEALEIKILQQIGVKNPYESDDKTS